MPLVKRIGFAVFIVLALAAASWAYLSLKKSKKPKLEAISVLPDSCLVYLNTSDLFELNRKLNSQNLLVDKLKLFKDIQRFCGTLQTVDSLLSSDETLRQELQGSLLHFALYRNMSWLLSFNIKQLGDQDHVTEQFLQLFHATKTDDDLYAFRLGAVRQLYFTLHSGVTLVSDSKEMIREALGKGPKLQNNRSFTEFKSTLEENSPLCLYTDHKLYAKSSAAAKLNLSALFKSGYSAGMIDLQPSQIIINGFAACDSAEVISLVSNQEAQEPDFVDQLPLSVTSFTAYGFSSFTTVQQHRARLFGAPAKAFWKQVSDSALYNLETNFYENVDNCLVAFETGSKKNMVLLNLSDTTKVREQLPLMTDSLVAESPVPLYRLRGGRDLPLFYPLAKSITRYVALYRNYLFFSESSGDLQNLLNDIKNGQLLINNESFVSYKSQNFPETFNFLIYSSPNRMKENMPEFFNFKAEPGSDPYKNFKHFSFCATNHASHFKFRWHLLNEAPTMHQYPNVLWSLDLDHPASATTATFANHVTGETELVLQDEANELYLLNAKGHVLWRKMLSEKIMSPVFTVDMFKNGRYQMLFSTEHYLHLIDRNGNDVKGYPVKLPASASGPLSVFDYDQDKDYRLFISCRNNTIYNYAISGTRQEHFAPVKTESEVNLPIQYVKVGQSDYLVAVDNEGKIYTFSRRGAGRIGLTNRTIQNCPAFYVDATNNVNSTFLVYVDDKNSLINKISFADRKEIVKLSSEVEGARVSFALVDENRNMDVIVSKANAIMAYDLHGNLLFEKDPENEFSRADFYSDESRSLFYGLSTAGDAVLMDQLSGRSSTYKATAIPLICSLFNDHKKYLVITNGKRLNCVLLN